LSNSVGWSANSFRGTLKSNSAIADLQMKYERELCQFAAVNGWRVQGLRKEIDDVAKR
jgi:hypothetical protein